MPLRKFFLKYGQKTVDFSIPEEDLMSILQGQKMRALENPQEKVREALRNPIQSPPLSQIVTSKDRIALIVPDRTRTVQADIYLPVLVDELNKAGVPDENIFIIFATGTHRLHTREEQEQIVGPEIAKRIKLFDHDCRDKRNLKYIGTTSRGTKVEINKRVLEADKIILTGGITYHYFAGFGGGRKAILPGIASFETVQANHRLTLEAEKKGSVKTGRLEGNPVHEDMEEAANLVKLDFLLNVVVNSDRKLAGIFAGHYIKAHGTGCRFVDDYARVKIDKKVDLVIVSSGGGTKDINFVQSHKAMENASYALKEGGVMILIAESKEGFPSEEYTKWLKYKTLKDHEQALHKEFSIPGHTVYSAKLKASRFKIIWLSGLPEEDMHALGITPVKSVDQALKQAYNILGKNRSTYIMPEGYITLPSLEED